MDLAFSWAPPSEVSWAHAKECRERKTTPKTEVRLCQSTDIMDTRSVLVWARCCTSVSARAGPRLLCHNRSSRRLRQHPIRATKSFQRRSASKMVVWRHRGVGASHSFLPAFLIERLSVNHDSSHRNKGPQKQQAYYWPSA